MASLKVEMTSLIEQTTSDCKLDKHVEVRVLPCSLACMEICFEVQASVNMKDLLMIKRGIAEDRS